MELFKGISKRDENRNGIYYSNWIKLKDYDLDIIEQVVNRA